MSIFWVKNSILPLIRNNNLKFSLRFNLKRLFTLSFCSFETFRNTAADGSKLLKAKRTQLLVFEQTTPLSKKSAFLQLDLCMLKLS